MSELGAPGLLQALRAHAGEVSCCAAHGARLATGGGALLRLWEWRAGVGWVLAAEARAAHRFGVTGARWAPSGVLLATCGVDGAVRVWCGRRLAARRLLAAGGAAAARALCWAGGRLLAGHDDGAVRVWAVGAARLLARLRPLDGAVHALCAPARHALLLVACTEGVLKVFDLDEVCRGGVEQGSGPAPLLAERGAHDLGALSAAHSEDGALAATGGHDDAVRLWRVEGRGRSRRVVADARLTGHSAAVTALAFAGGGGGVLASASLDRTVRLWALRARACLHVLHAHPRYLTCLALAPDLAYLVTGSNDKTVRTWSLRGLALADELAPACDGLPHFAQGDLQGISPLDDDELVELDALVTVEEEGGERAGGARLTWRGRLHAGAVNCIAAQGDLLATASSDGLVKVLRVAGGALEELHVLDAHQYPAQSVAWGAGLLLSAGLDGQAVLWDTQAGCRLRTLALGAGGGDAGGGGVRDVAVSPHRPPLLLLATDDGLAPVWSLAEDDPLPIHVYLAGEAAGAAWCVAWAPCGAAAALGGAGGELRVLAPPPPHAEPRQLAIVADAHDLGVTSCEFAGSAGAAGLGAGEGEGGRLALATAGGDSLIKLWIVDMDEDEGGAARVQLARLIGAHGGAAARACWGGGGGGALLVSAGADDWARVWADGACVAAVPAAAAGAADSALAAALIREDGALYLALGTLQGTVALWRLPAGLEDAREGGEEEAALDTRWWGPAGVRHWLQEYVTRVPGSVWSSEAEGRLLGAARGAGLTGARLLDDPLPDLMRASGYGSASSDSDSDSALALASESEDEAPRARLRRELRWLRRAPPAPQSEASAPHALLCALSHRLLAAPARAADGVTYERQAAQDWFLAAEGAVSGVSGRRLRSARLLPNHGVRRALRRHLRAARGPPAGDVGDRAPGAGGDQAPGAGGDQAPGAGGDQAPGAGGDQAPGAGGDQAPGAGGDQAPGAGGDRAPGAGGDQAPGAGGDQAPGAGGDQAPGAGGDQAPGAGGDQAPGAGGDQAPGAGGDQAPGAGGDQAPGTGWDQVPRTVGDQSPGSGEDVDTADLLGLEE